MHNFKENQENLPKICELIRIIIIELITAFNNSNYKTRKISEETF